MARANQPLPANLKVALAHDYLRDYGGAERVLEALHELFPEAPVFVAFADPKAMGHHWQRFADWDIRQSWLTKIPGYRRWFSPLRIWSPQYFRSFDLSGYDLVISSTNAYFAKAITVPAGAKHVCYCHTPSRSLYGYTTMSDWKKNPLIRVAGEVINHYLRLVDFEVARQNVDVFIANSTETARRIQKFYRRDSEVVYPPCAVPSQPPTATADGYYLYVNRLALAKHPELAIQAANRLQLPLKVVGDGPLFGSLRELCGPTVEMLGSVTDDELRAAYQGAKALLYPVEDEDFGMVPVEAMGYGLPVIAHRSGGPQETIVDGKTGIFFDELTVESLTEAIQKATKHSWSKSAIWRHAQQYSTDHFAANIRAIVAKTLSAKV